MAALKCLIQLGVTTLSSSSTVGQYECRRFSQLVKSNGTPLVDSLAVVKSLEEQGVPSKQAEEITSAFIDVLNESLEKMPILSFQNQKCKKLKLSKNLTFPCSNLKFRVHRHDIDRVIHAIGALLEAAKYDVIKYYIGTLVFVLLLVWLFFVF